MTTLYRRHDVLTIAEVNSLALTDGQENGAFVLGPYAEGCSWTKPYATRNEPTEPGHWSYQDGYGGDHLRDGDPVTVLVPIEAEEETHSIQTRGQTTPEWRTRLVTPWEEAPPAQD